MDDTLELIRSTLAGRRAWLVGGAVRDRLLDRRTQDYDVVLDGEPREAARALARAAGRASIGGATAFALSEEYGGWRVVARDGAWQVDVERLRGATLEEDLGLRDFTVNALAEPLGESGGGAGETIDPLGGIEDLARRRLRAGAPRAFAEDPLRVLRLVRLAVELDLEPDGPTRAQARAHAQDLRAVAGERVFMELRRIIDAPRAVYGVELMGEVGATPVVLPELDATRGVQQSRYHHLDVYGHTLEVLARTIELTTACERGACDLGALLAGREQVLPARNDPSHTDPSHIDSSQIDSSQIDLAHIDPSQIDPSQIGRHASVLAALLAEPLADGLTRGGALRWGALLHDVAKPLTREVRPTDGRVTFIGHDVLGAQMAGEVLGRLRASGRLQAHVAALVRHHLRLGFLVHDPQPLARRRVFAYLRACEPVEVDVTLLSVADRLATCGERAEESIDAHLRLARAMLADAIGWRTDGPPQPLLRGDDLASDLGIPEGPRLGKLLEELLEAQYAGDISTRDDALAYARERAG